MNTKHRFYRFVTKDKLEENRKYMAAWSTRANDNTKLPMSVNNFLNMVPSKNRHQVLSWILSEGKRKASIARRFMTDEYNKKYNLGITQAELFSPRAYKRNANLGKLKDQIERDWFDHEFEPRYIPITSYSKDGIKRIDAYQINAHLEDMGLEPMYYGGPNGLLKHIEEGSWAIDQFNADSLDDAQGHDLALNPGDSGIYDATAAKLNDLYAELEKAKEAGDNPKQLEIQDKIDMVKKEDPVRLLKLGLGKGGYVPSTNPRHYKNSIERSQLDSRDLISKIIEDLKAGKKFSQLDAQEIRMIQKLHDSGKIQARTEVQTLKQIMGIVKGTKDEVRTNKDKKFIPHAKASVKALLMSLMNTPPIDPSKVVDTTSFESIDKTAMGPDITAKGLSNAKVTIQDVGTFKLDQIPREGDANYSQKSKIIEELADKMTDAMFDNETGSFIPRSVKVTRSYGVFGNASVEIKDKLQNEAFFGTKKNTKAQNALLSLGNKPISVNFDGKKVEVMPQDVINSLKSNEIKKYGLAGKVVDPSMKSELVKINPKELEQQGYKQTGKSANVLTYTSKNTGKTKKITKIGNDFFEYVPAKDVAVTNDINDPKNKVSEFGNGKYAKIVYPNGTSITARRSVDDNGADVWTKIRDAKDSVNTDPLLYPIKVKVNSGLGDLRSELVSDPKQSAEKWSHFLSNPEEYGDQRTKINGVPFSVLKGVGKNHNAISYASEELMKNISNPSFKFGDLKTKAETGRKNDIYDDLASFLSSDEVSDVVSFVHHALFANAGKKTGKRTLEKFNGPELFEYPNKVREDIYDAFIHNGFEWRRRKSGSIARSVQNKEGFSGVASGSGGDDEKKSLQDLIASQQDDLDQDEISNDDLDDYDDLYMGDDEESIQRKGDPEAEGEDIDYQPTVGAPIYSKENPKGIRRSIANAYAIVSDKDDEINRPFFIGRNRGQNPNIASRPMTPQPQSIKQQAAPVVAQSAPATTLSLAQRMKGKFGKPKNSEDPLSFLESGLISYKQWLYEQSAVYDPKVKVKDGCGFNWLGAVGDPMGVSISGEVNNKKTGKSKNAK